MSEKSPKNIKNTCKTNIYKFRANSKKAQQVNPSPFKSAQVPWTYFFILFFRWVNLHNDLPTGKCTLKGNIGGKEKVFELNMASMEKVDGKNLSLHRLAAKAQIKQLEDEVSEESRSNRG